MTHQMSFMVISKIIFMLVKAGETIMAVITEQFHDLQSLQMETIPEKCSIYLQLQFTVSNF